MAIPKVMGIETEYGITVRNHPDFNPILSSLLLINSYETYRARVRWDYEAESPLRDARGFDYAEEKEVPSKEESRLINLILPNGARYYVDHAHPEYSTPECTNPRDLVIWDRAGERILFDAMWDGRFAGSAAVHGQAAANVRTRAKVNRSMAGPSRGCGHGRK